MRSRSISIATVLILAVCTFLFSSRTAEAQANFGFDANAESQFVSMINGVRANQGLPALIVDPELVANGRNWSVTMSNAGDIFHTNDQSVGLSTPWVLLGENVGVGPNVQSLFDAFIASPTHYANIVQPDFDYIGVGVYLTGDTMWTVQRYRDEGQIEPPAEMAEVAVEETIVEETVPEAAPPETEPAPEPTTEPTTTAAPTTAAPTTATPTTAPVPTTPTTPRRVPGPTVSADAVRALAETVTDALRFA